MNIKVHKDYSDELIQKVFIEEGLGAVKNKGTLKSKIFRYFLVIYSSDTIFLTSS